jgi:hypothetical protein
MRTGLPKEEKAMAANKKFPESKRARKKASSRRQPKRDIPTRPTRTASYTPDIRAAYRAFFLRCTIPLLHENGKKEIVGTGTLFDYSGQLFMVTAAHIFKRYKIYEIGVPEALDGPNAFTLGQLNAASAPDEDIDIAVLNLHNREICERLRKEWRVLSKENVSLENSEQTPYILAGCPDGTAEIVNKHIIAKWFDMYTSPYAGSTDNARGVFDIFLKYPPEIYGKFGLTISKPKLQGISGASVWQAIQKSEGLWAAEKEMRVIGVQVAAAHEKYLVVKSWRLVAEILYQQFNVIT